MELVNLPNEIKSLIIERMNYIDVFNLSHVSKHFYQLRYSNKSFDQKMLMSKHMITFDDGFFYFLSGELADLSYEIRKKFSNTYEKKFIFSVAEKKIQNLVYNLLPFKIYNHLFFCYRGCYTTGGKWKHCTRFFVDDFDKSYYIDYHFKITKPSLGNNSVKELGSSQDNRKKNFSEIFKQVIGTLLSLYIAYNEVFFRIYFKKFRLVEKRFHDFSGGKKDYDEKKKKIEFSFLKLFVLRGRRILDYLNLVLNDLAFSHIFLTYRANIDYLSEHLLIANSK